jgi:hypothetical protein
VHCLVEELREFRIVHPHVVVPVWQLLELEGDAHGLQLPSPGQAVPRFPKHLGFTHRAISKSEFLEIRKLS